MVPTVQILSKKVDFSKKLRLKGNAQYTVLQSKSIYYTFKKVKEEKVDFILLNLIEGEVRDEFYKFTNKNSYKHNLYLKNLLFLSPIELSQDKQYLSCIHKYPYQDQLWWSDCVEDTALIDSLDFFLKRNISFMRTYQENLLLKEEKKIFLSLEEFLPSPPKKSHVNRGENKPPYSFLVGESRRIKECRTSIEIACKKNNTILLIGEAGLEQKEIARYIHLNSSRSELPFVYINLHQINNKMHFRKLFGHIHKNQFDSGKPIGLTDQISGTLLLEGIENLLWDTQAYVLKAIHDRDILNKKADKLKLILSTNKDINFILDSDLFRQDLVSKVKINMIQLPNLKERKTDIVYLIDQYLSWYEKKYKKSVDFTSELKLTLAGYHWRENLYSLYECLGQLLSIANKKICDVGTLKLIEQTRSSTNFIREKNAPITPSLFSESILRGNFQPELENVEKLYVEQVLKFRNGNVASTARILGISRKTLYAKLKLYNLKVS